MTEHVVDCPWKIKHLLTGNEHKNFHDNLTNEQKRAQCLCLQHLTVNLRGGELNLRFNQQSSPMEVIVQQLDSNKVRQQTVHIIKVPPPP